MSTVHACLHVLSIKAALLIFLTRSEVLIKYCVFLLNINFKGHQE